MTILVDVNLSPAWCAYLASHGHNAIHWISVGKATATDNEIMQWAAMHNHTVFTHDLDFGAILAATSAHRPSVLQVRCSVPLPEAIGPLVLAALHQFAEQIHAGALVTIDARRARARLLPFQ
jgi:predicted nuclease of predicted toxin-antitoxin system